MRPQGANSRIYSFAGPFATLGLVTVKESVGNETGLGIGKILNEEYSLRAH